MISKYEGKQKEKRKSDEWKQKEEEGSRAKEGKREVCIYMCKMKNTNGIRKLVAVLCRKPAIYVLKRK